MAEKKLDSKDEAPKKADPKVDPKGDPKEMAELKDKAQHPDAPKDNPVNPARPQDPDPDEMQLPKNFTPQGDAVPMDPMLAPEAQQPFESYEDWQQRVGKPKPEPGVYDTTVTRGKEPG